MKKLLLMIVGTFMLSTSWDHGVGSPDRSRQIKCK